MLFDLTGTLTHFTVNACVLDRGDILVDVVPINAICRSQ